MAQNWQHDISDFFRLRDLIQPIIGDFQHISQQHFNDKIAIKKLYHNLMSTVIELNSEEVECRRRDRPTRRYQDLTEEYEKNREILEETFVMFKLLY